MKWAKNWRKAIRALHRDAGYLAVGLTIIYALSGLAVNHIADWDPNFSEFSETDSLPDDQDFSVSVDDEAGNERVARRVLHALGISESPRSVYAASPHELDITLDGSDIHVDTATRRVVRTGQQERFFLRAANYLHLNRGKKAWTYMADGYAATLLWLAVSGLFMIRGSKGIGGRGGVLVFIGAALPVAYVVLSPP